ncbi:MAG TPA: oxalate/formate MFS antiporter [Casimicrobiaceae bacterium]|nr:oxalate/formate MFS antiporter [Casimicrobiaceae bacterium]
MAQAPARPAANTRWLQLIVGIICMIMIANLQYGWTLFVNPIDQAHHWGRAAIQVAFSVFVACETWLVPVEGWFVDKFGPRIVVALGGILVAIAWTIDSHATTLPMLYVAGAIAGVGAGAVYGTCVGNALKWFADRRGLAAGLTAAGFGAGAALTVIPIRLVIGAYGYESAFLWFGLVQGAVVLILSQLLRAPKAGEVVASGVPKVAQTAHDFAPSQVLRTPTFWLLYVMFVCVAAGGLMATAQIAPIAHDYNLANTPIDFSFFAATTLSVALVVDNILNGLARPFFGWVSDHVGRENTMAGVFIIGAISYWALGTLGTSPVAFVLFAGLIYFTWGEIYSLFPAACTDTFGRKFATTNAGLLYTAKGMAAWLVPLANVLKSHTGSWHAVFMVATVLNVAVALAALFVLKPMRAAQIRKASGASTGRETPAPAAA